MIILYFIIGVVVSLYCCVSFWRSVQSREDEDDFINHFMTYVLTAIMIVFIWPIVVAFIVGFGLYAAYEENKNGQI